MALSLVGKNKVGFVDDRYPKTHFDVSLHDQWEKVNFVVFSWIMNSMRKDLLSSIIYASNAHSVWIDLKERFDKVNGSGVFVFHGEIVSLNQDMLSSSDYFSRMRTLLDEFDALMPSPRCNCSESRSYAQHFKYQRVAVSHGTE